MTLTLKKFCVLGAVTSLTMGAEFSLAQSVDDEIIVTGSRLLEGSLDDAITGISVLAGDALEDRLAATIGETLKSEPGVSSSFFGAGASRPIIRGQGGDRVRVLTNGIGSIDASSASPDHAVAAEPAQAERIEVLRGASLLRFGSSGSGGVVNVIDGRIPHELPEDGSETAIRMGASSVDQGFEVAGSTDRQLGSSIVLHVDGTWREAGDYRIPGFAESDILHDAEEEGHEDHDDDHEDDLEHEDEDRGGELRDRMENSWLESGALTAGLSYIGDDGFIGVSVHKFDSRYGIPGGHGHEGEEEEHEEEHGEEEHEEEEAPVSIELDQVRLDFNAAKDLTGFFERVQLFAGAADYKHTEFEGTEIGTVFANQGGEARLEVIQSEINDWRAAYGAQYREREFSAIGEEAFVPPTLSRQYGAYMFHEKEFDDIHLELAGRYERTDQSNELAGSQRNFDLFSLSGGGDVHLSDKIRFGTTIFRTERAPTTEELFSNGPHLATNAFERGNALLGKEISQGAEIAYRHRGDNHFLTANLFYTKYDDYIYQRFSGEIEDGLDVFEFAADDATFKGFEIQASSDIGTYGNVDFSLDGLAEFVRAKTDSGNLPRIPPLSFLVGGEAQWDRFNLRAEYEYADAQNKIGDQELRTESYGLANMFLTWTMPSEQNVKLKVSILNLLNSEARQHTSFLKDIVPLPGRNIRFSLSAKI